MGIWEATNEWNFESRDARCHEGHRWEDLKRWGMLDTQAGIDELKTRDADFEHFVLGRHQSLPIPTIEINNNPNLEPNPKF